MSTPFKGLRLYFKGDQVELTGKVEEIYHGIFHEFRFLDGHDKGSLGWLADKVVQRQVNAQDISADFELSTEKDLG